MAGFEIQSLSRGNAPLNSLADYLLGVPFFRAQGAVEILPGVRIVGQQADERLKLPDRVVQAARGQEGDGQVVAGPNRFRV